MKKIIILILLLISGCSKLVCECKCENCGEACKNQCDGLRCIPGESCCDNCICKKLH